MSEVPRLFHSVEFEGPFVKCLHCQVAFNKMDVPHLISKSFRGAECVMEYAMCQNCHLEMVESFSQESRSSLEKFHLERVDFSARSEKLEGNEHYTDWLKECLTCGIEIQYLKEYSIAAMGFENTMVYDPFPRMMCGACEIEMQETLSSKTRDQWDRFIRDHFEGPPAESLTPDGRIPVLA